MEKQQVALKFEFRGFRLIKVDFNHTKDLPFNSFSLYTTKHLYDEKSQIMELITEIHLKTPANEDSMFVFSSGYKINDLNWLEIMAEQTVINELFKVCFPYLREKIFEITTDFRPGFLIPVLNEETFDFTKQINFNFERKEEPRQQVKIETDMIN